MIRRKQVDAGLPLVSLPFFRSVDDSGSRAIWAALAVFLAFLGCSQSTSATRVPEEVADSSGETKERTGSGPELIDAEPQKLEARQELMVEDAPASRPSDSIVDSHDRMLARLQEVHIESQDNPYFGRGALRIAKGNYDQAKAAGDVVKTLKAIVEVGKELTFSGKPDDALKTYAQADILLQAMRRSGAPGPLVSQWEARVFLGKGIAGFRKAENENCVHCQEGEGCLFPIRPKGIHKVTEGAELARDSMVEVIRRSPDNITAVWLLNLAHMTLGTFPDGVPETYDLPRSRLTSETEFPWFRNVSASLGLDTMSLSGGVIAEDFDGDHWLDIIVSDWSSTGQIRFFHNNGDGTFTDQTEGAGLIGIFGGLNINQADYDNDGDMDVLVLRGAWLRETGNHPNSLLQNDGKGNFRDVSYESGIAGDDFPTQTAAWSDFDRDGDLDLFVGNEQHPSQLFLNDGEGHFVDSATQYGLTVNAFTKGVAWGDYNSDGFPDLYVSNYMSPNVMFRNDGGKGFTDVTQLLGVAGPDASFAVWFWDYNNDGHLDLFCPGYLEGVQHVAADYFEMKSRGQTDVLYQGDGKDALTEVGKESGFTHVTQTMGCNFGDLDNDGFLDIYLGTGYPGFEALMPNVMYRNDAGKQFRDVSVAGGFSHLQKGHAIAFADFDHDGDQDVFAELGGAYPGDGFRNALFANPGFGNNSVVVRLIGTDSPKCAIGARIEATFADGDVTRTVYRTIGSGSSFGANSMREMIGCGQATKIDQLIVHWPRSGQKQVFSNLAANRLFLITERDSDVQEVQLRASSL